MGVQSQSLSGNTLAKVKRMSYKNVNPPRRTMKCEKIMADVCYIGVTSMGGKHLFLLIEDECTRFKWGVLLQRKSECVSSVKHVIDEDRSDGKSVKIFGSDQGSEVVNTQMKEMLLARGIKQQWTNAYSPEENSLVEKLNFVILSKVRACLLTVNLPDSL